VDGSPIAAADVDDALDAIGHVAPAETSVFVVTGQEPDTAAAAALDA